LRITFCVYRTTTTSKDLESWSTARSRDTRVYVKIISCHVNELGAF
jgi:hypothetical protein